MRDDRNRWPPLQGDGRAPLFGQGVQAQVIKLQQQTVISGAFNDCLSACGLDTAAGSGPDIATGDTYAVRQRRDRIVVVNGPALTDGWNDKHNVAVSDMTAAYCVISLLGPNAERVIATGTEFDSNLPSPSVSRLWHGFGILLYQHEKPNNYRIHIRSAHLESLWEMLARQISALVGLLDKPAAYADLEQKRTGTKRENARVS
ncbi:hypothetical protein Q4577_17735 [Marinovum sp. 2_MG-2023]|uniref:hypothetical protein n=1 Tax=unclassified Marinovum TaxID=2647166 RepID=UPI0026E3DB09|nr:MULTISPECIES: hypothetical protein [unclassified Marinovum]MDO6731878.1 hypothetical protein [Marinovum sp. 2_MG-2023]MDO6781130.1 hypothetical protein [Marinovum sp. 1_MG-2023]